jgi:hypothetical protein
MWEINHAIQQVSITNKKNAKLSSIFMPSVVIVNVVMTIVAAPAKGTLSLRFAGQTGQGDACQLHPHP